jgi:hypothetical protein
MAVKGVLRVFVLLMVVLVFLSFAGCGGDDDGYCVSYDLPSPKVSWVDPYGGEIASDTIITVTFSRKVAYVTITINDTEVPACTTDDKIFTFVPGQEGELTLGIEAVDCCDRSLDPPFPGVTYMAGPPDIEEPEEE